MRLNDSRALIFVLVFLFVAGLIFSSYVIYRSFELVKEEEPDNVGRISFKIIPKPEAPPEATGESTIKFKIIEKPEE